MQSFLAKMLATALSMLIEALVARLLRALFDATLGRTPDIAPAAA